MAYSYDARPYRAVFDRQFTFIRGFWRNVHRYSDRTALYETATSTGYDYAELGDLVRRLAAGLSERGVRARDVVAFQLYNSLEFAVTYLAAEHLGAVATPINFRFAPGETAHVLGDSRPAVFLYDGREHEIAQAALELASHRPAVIAATGSMAQLDVTPFEELLAAAGHEEPAAGVTAWDETVRLYTSGTTGMPKGVSLPAAAEVMTAHDVIMHFPLEPQDRTLNMTPWFHRGGISPGGPNAVFYAGAATVTMPKFEADTCLDLVMEHGLTFLVGAPTNLAMLADAQERRPRDLSTLRGIVTMGAPLERAACLRYQQVLTPRIFNGYGTTEAFWNTFLRPADLPEHAGSAGRSCTDDDVRVVVVRPDGRAAPDDTVPQDGTSTGEIIMRSLKSGYAYVNNPTEQEAKFADGWLYSGDLGTWDADEYVTVIGRKDDMFISGGENIHPVQVEEVLNQHPGVADSIVVGMDDERWGKLCVAYVQRSDPAVTAENLDKHCQANPMLSNYKRPKAYRFVDELPRTATGKKMHYVVRAEVAAGGGVQGLVHPW